MTRVAFPNFFVTPDETVLFERLAHNPAEPALDYASIVQGLVTGVEDGAFEEIQQPGALNYATEEAARERMAQVDRSARKGFAASYLARIKLIDGQPPEPAGIISYMYPGAGGMGARIRASVAPQTNPVRDFAGYLRNDRLTTWGAHPGEAAIRVGRGSMLLADRSGIEILRARVKQEHIDQPVRDELTVIEGLATTLGFTQDTEEGVQTTEGREFHGIGFTRHAGGR